MSKRLGRPKGKNKPKDAASLLHVWLSPAAKEAFEHIRLAYRVKAYNAKEHGEAPTSLPLARNSDVVDRIILETLERQGNIERLERNLFEKGCLNAAELLGLPEGPEQ